jgi:hypothetical protein
MAYYPGFYNPQGLEHCHIDFCKKVAACTNNKDIILTIMHHHVWEGHLQYLQKLHADLADEDGEEVLPRKSTEEWLARNDSISCELCIILFCRLFFLGGKPSEPDGKWM